MGKRKPTLGVEEATEAVVAAALAREPSASSAAAGGNTLQLRRLRQLRHLRKAEAAVGDDGRPGWQRRTCTPAVVRGVRRTARHIPRGSCCRGLRTLQPDNPPVAASALHTARKQLLLLPRQRELVQQMASP